MKRIASVLLVLLLAFCQHAFATDTITVTTWNVEKLGSSGRGFAGGYGRTPLPLRTDQQLIAIADFIRNDLQSDVIALQEVSITHIDGDRSRSRQLDVIANRLGVDWQYFLPPISQEELDELEDNLFVGFLWNRAAVFANRMYVMQVTSIDMAGAPLFKRKPVVGYFDVMKNTQRTNDFVLVNVHLKSGQQFDENHLIAMTVIEYGLTRSLANHQVKESDRIILGDFNDNPYAQTAAGNQKYSQALYQHMTFKKYTDLVQANIQYTRMNANLDSILDHVLVNVSANNHLDSTAVVKYVPDNAPDSFAQWRRTYSDHFPLSFEIKVENNDDDVDFH